MDAPTENAGDAGPSGTAGSDLQPDVNPSSRDHVRDHVDAHALPTKKSKGKRKRVSFYGRQISVFSETVGC